MVFGEKAHVTVMSLGGFRFPNGIAVNSHLKL